MGERELSVLVHSLFSSWMLAFLFEGQIFYSLANAHQIDPAGMVFSGVAAIFAGLLLCRLLIKTNKAAKRRFLGSNPDKHCKASDFFVPLHSNHQHQLGAHVSGRQPGLCAS